MKAQENSQPSQNQRLRVDLESGQLKISSELYHPNLGWYAAGSVRLDRELLFDLEQALQGVKRECHRPENRPGKVLHFPSVASGSRTQS